MEITVFLLRNSRTNIQSLWPFYFLTESPGPHSGEGNSTRTLSEVVGCGREIRQYWGNLAHPSTKKKNFFNVFVYHNKPVPADVWKTECTGYALSRPPVGFFFWASESNGHRLQALSWKDRETEIRPFHMVFLNAQNSLFIGWCSTLKGFSKKLKLRDVEQPKITQIQGDRARIYKYPVAEIVPHSVI